MDAAYRARAPAQSPLKAALFMIGAVVSFSILDASLKALSAEHPLAVLVFVRNLVQVVSIAALVPFVGWGAVGTRRYGLHTARGGCLVLSTVLLTLSLSHLPMTQAYALSFSSPLFASLLAAATLRERPSRLQWIAIVMGFSGVLVALEPRGEMQLALVLPLAMAGANAAMHVLTRRAGNSDSALSMVFWAGLSATVISAFALPICYEPMPLSAWAWIVAAGLFGTAGHLMLAAAFRRAPTAVVSPLVYTQLGCAMLIGWFAFGEWPTVCAISGGVIVAASGIAVVWFARA
jgi:drug/metabolite transporter (DMT)-like permease